jgi:hypothetical protein
MNKSKYQIGDKVWIINDNEITGNIITIISGIDFYDNDVTCPDYQKEYMYAFVLTNRVCYWQDVKWFKESKLFPTKQDLINSL